VPSDPRPEPAPVAAVPRRMRVVCAVVAAVVVGVMVVAAVLLKQTTGVVVIHTSDQVGMAVLGLLLGAGVLLLARPRVDADAATIRVRNVVTSHELPWAVVQTVRFGRKAPWASLLLENGDEVAVMALQAVDKERALVAVEGLRALHAAARPQGPPKLPLLHED
jgi:Bacterial PH domain